MKRVIAIMTILIFVFVAFCNTQKSVYAPGAEGEGEEDLNQTGNQTPPINQTPDLNITAEDSFNLTNTNPEDPYSTLTTNNGKFRFYRRNVNEKLVEFEDNEGYKLSFSPDYQPPSYSIEDNHLFEASYKDFKTVYETISNTKVKNTIVFYSKPDSNIINETFSYDSDKLEYYMKDGSIYFSDKKLPNQLINHVPKFKIEKPYATDSNNTYGSCYYEVDNYQLRLIIDQDFLESALYPICVDPTWVDNTRVSWDNGTKDNGGDGNWLIESGGINGDNFAIPNNTIQLSNRLGDNFNYTDADALTWKWGAVAPPFPSDSGTYSYDINTTASGRLYIYSTRVAGVNAAVSRRNNIGYTLDVSQPFDIRAYIPSAILSHDGSITIRVDDSDSAPNDEYVWVGRWHNAANDKFISAVRIGGASTGNAYAGSALSAFYLRLYYDGVTYRGQFSTDNAAWTTVNSKVGTMSGNGHIVLRDSSSTNNGQETIAQIEWFRIYSGTISATTHRLYGNWTGQNLTLSSGARINNWTVNITNADANNYVNISFLQGEDEKARYNNITSNITLTLETCPDLASVRPGTFQYKLEFNGNGSSSPIVHASYGYQNYRPIAVIADDDIDTEPLTLVELNGTPSYDSDGSIVNYTWSATINGTPIYLYGEVVNYTFTEEGTYLFELRVTDNNNYTSIPAECYITVTDPAAPDEDDDNPVTSLSQIGPALILIIFLIAILAMFAKLREYQRNKPLW